MTDLLAYLQTCVAIQAQNSPINGYTSLADFVFKNGRSFTPAPLPKGFEFGEVRGCFRNASLLAIGSRRLIYVEGYAFGIIPTEHAWCVDQQGNVYDNTWREPGIAYFGIPFLRAYLLKQLRKDNSVYGLIGEGRQARDLIVTPPKKWKYNYEG